MTVNAYPQLGRKVGESGCVAGIALDRHGWIRVNPCDFRALPEEHQFDKYQAIELEVRKTPTDARPESFTPWLEGRLGRVERSPLGGDLVRVLRCTPLVRHGLLFVSLDVPKPRREPSTDCWTA